MTSRAALVTAGVQPVLWTALGVQFEAASMSAGLASCLTVRIWISLTDVPSKAWGWGVDLSVTAIAMLFTAGWIVLERPAPFYAMLCGTGFGALGTGIITMAVAWVKRIEPLAPRDRAGISHPDTSASPSPKDTVFPGDDGPSVSSAETGRGR